MQKEYQALEHAEQLKIAEQKRVEQAKIKAAQAAKAAREARMAAAREEARIRAEKDTRYTRAMKRYLGMDRDGSARTLRDHYKEAAITANRNRGRTPSPPRSIIGVGLDQDVVTAKLSRFSRHFLHDQFRVPVNVAQYLGDGIAFVAGAGLHYGQMRGSRGRAPVPSQKLAPLRNHQSVSAVSRQAPVHTHVISKAAQSSTASAAAHAVSTGPVTQILKRAHSAGVRSERIFQAPYNPRQTLEDFQKIYPRRVTSTTVPAPHQPNVKLANTRHPVTGVVFDQRGLPIFDSHAKVDLRIDKAKALVSGGEAHKVEATKQLRQLIGEGKINSDLFTEEQLLRIQKGSAQIPGLTWHHHQDIGRMQLVSREIHEKTKHVGGDYLWFQGE